MVRICKTLDIYPHLSLRSFYVIHERTMTLRLLLVFFILNFSIVFAARQNQFVFKRRSHEFYAKSEPRDAPRNTLASLLHPRCKATMWASLSDLQGIEPSSFYTQRERLLWKNSSDDVVDRQTVRSTFLEGYQSMRATNKVQSRQFRGDAAETIDYTQRELIFAFEKVYNLSFSGEPFHWYRCYR